MAKKELAGVRPTCLWPSGWPAVPRSMLHALCSSDALFINANRKLADQADCWTGLDAGCGLSLWTRCEDNSIEMKITVGRANSELLPLQRRSIYGPAATNC